MSLPLESLKTCRFRFSEPPISDAADALRLRLRECDFRLDSFDALLLRDTDLCEPADGERLLFPGVTLRDLEPLRDEWFDFECCE